MDCCAPKIDDKKNDETSTKNLKQEDGSHERSGGGCCGNPWLMVAVMIVFGLFLILTRS